MINTVFFVTRLIIGAPFSHDYVDLTQKVSAMVTTDLMIVHYDLFFRFFLLLIIDCLSSSNKTKKIVVSFYYAFLKIS
jgi:hypothetical protein